MGTAEPTMLGLLSLPDELLTHVWSYLSAVEAARTARVCARLRNIVYDDLLWHRYLQAHLPNPLSSRFPAASYRDLYLAHQPYWFIPEHKIWYDDNDPYGRLIVARYDQRRGCIEAYTLIAEDGQQEPKITRWLDGAVIAFYSFSPVLGLDKNRPTISIPLAPKRDVSASPGKHRALQIELLMNNANDVSNGNTDSPCSSLMLTIALPSSRQTSQTSMWPPSTIPSIRDQRTHNESASSFKSKGHRPANHGEKSDATFRVRQWVEFGRFSPLANILPGSNRVAERVTTYATLPKECYTPTKEKPWQGLWVGDFSGHGCEFLLVTQPDHAAPLPRKARKAWRMWPRNGVRRRSGSLVHVDPDDSDYYAASSDDDDDDDEQGSGSGSGSGSTLSPVSPVAHGNSSSSSNDWPDPDPSPAVAETNLDAALDFLEADRRRRCRSSSADRHVRSARARTAAADPAPWRGRLEAIKLTGDPNVPRGEYTFLAPDLGAAGLVGHVDDPLFFDEEAQRFAAAHGQPPGQGARVVRSVGHIADSGFRNDCYIPSQLVLMSGGRLAQYWSCWGHLAFFQRVHVDALLHV